MGLEFMVSDLQTQLEQVFKKNLTNKECFVSEIIQEVLSLYAAIRFLAEVRSNQHILDNTVKQSFNHPLKLKAK
ncbi:MAG: hypothetical protein QS721_09385 [Candidatus Endonucleobacter sp. (ex Gigantidas childressi)]|nr:hypothetical protein [Candidatus Endonucleobacter sp. (ex Gigantidas childressi)]